MAAICEGSASILSAIWQRTCANEDAEVIPETSCFVFLYRTSIGMSNILVLLGYVFDLEKCAGDSTGSKRSWVNTLT